MPVMAADGRQVEWEISPSELAILFGLKEWTYGTKQCAGPPAAKDIETTVAELANTLDAEGIEGDYISGGRFLVYTDPELPRSKDVYLYVGYMWEGDDPEGNG